MIASAATRLTITLDDLALMTDLYQLTMMACYVGEGLAEQSASFELFVRRLPPDFGYLIAMGLQDALAYLENLHFSPSQIEQLQATGLFEQAPAGFWRQLANFRFSGSVWAVAEGTAVFAQEPLLRVEAPLWQAQLVETYLLNTLNYQTLIATRAARLRHVAGPAARLLEFGTRRAFSPQAALWAARAALAAGFDATSNVLAALQLGEKPSGTMAHALVMAFKATAGSEDEAFTAFQRYFPRAPLLIDTFDTMAAAERLAQQVQAGSRQVHGVRLDSGDLVALAQAVRRLLPDIQIWASGDLDETAVAALMAQGASLDGFGIGTKLVTGTPVNGVYKLVDIAGQPTLKCSQDKATYPGRKQVFRSAQGDRLALATESPVGAEVPLLQRVMEQGQRQLPLESLAQLRQRTAESVEALALELQSLTGPHPDPVSISESLEGLRQSLL